MPPKHAGLEEDSGRDNLPQCTQNGAGVYIGLQSAQVAGP